MCTDINYSFDSAVYYRANFVTFLNACDNEFSLENPRAYLLLKYMIVARNNTCDREVALKARDVFLEHFHDDVLNIGTNEQKKIYRIYEEPAVADAILQALSMNMVDTASRMQNTLAEQFPHVFCSDATGYLNLVESAINVSFSIGKNKLPEFRANSSKGRGRKYGVLGSAVQKLFSCRR